MGKKGVDINKRSDKRQKGGKRERLNDAPAYLEISVVWV